MQGKNNFFDLETRIDQLEKHVQELFNILLSLQKEIEQAKDVVECSKHFHKNWEEPVVP